MSPDHFLTILAAYCCNKVTQFDLHFYFNICSKSTKGSSRELMLFTMHIKKKELITFTRFDRTKTNRQKTHRQSIGS